MSRHQSTKQWLSKHQADPFVKQSKVDGYRSRAVYKLKEVNEKVKLIRQGMLVLELGAAPGGWTQYISECIGHHGKIVAVDCLPMDTLPFVNFIKGDFTEDETQLQIEQALENKKADIILSDMAPNLSGVKVADSLRAIGLAEITLDAAHQFLKPGGHLFMKLFHGVGFDEFVKLTRASFKQVSIRKPRASRSQSRETYLLAMDYSPAQGSLSNTI